MGNVMIISSDGHAAPPMREYTSYIDPQFRDDFDAFCVTLEEMGFTHMSTSAALQFFIDEDLALQWDEDKVDTGRVEGLWNAERRLKEMEREGIAGEVLIPDFGLPFTMAPAAVIRLRRAADSAANDSSLNQLTKPTWEQTKAGDRAFNRWLADFAATAPERFAAQANIHFDEVEFALDEIRRAKEAGLKGVMIPTFDPEAPLFSRRFDPIWSLLEDLDMPLTSHAAVSLTSAFMFNCSEVPHPGCAGPLGRVTSLAFTHWILDHLVWGGVFERHPHLRVVFTEQGSGWLASKLPQMDYTYSGSYMRQDLKSVITMSPSEYFQRQCWIGSSLLAQSEVENRYAIGVDKMMFGADYPHFEGSWNGGTFDYLQACFGSSNVPESEARMMLGKTIAQVYDFDVDKLVPLVERIGPTPERLLTPPIEDKFPAVTYISPWVASPCDFRSLGWPLWQRELKSGCVGLRAGSISRAAVKRLGAAQIG